MSTYDERGLALAVRMLAPKSAGGKGQAITLTRKTGGAYNPATSQVEGTGTASQYTSGIVTEYKSASRGGLQRQDGSLVQSGDRSLRLSPYAVDGTPLNPGPGLDDQITLASGQTYTITTVSMMNPAGLVIYYDCNIRGVS